MSMTRRDWLYVVGQTALLAQDGPASSDLERRAARIVRDYEEQGIHRTGTAVDQASADWLAHEVRECGLTPERESFTISRVDPVAAWLSSGKRRMEGIPLFDGGFTDSEGV